MSEGGGSRTFALVELYRFANTVLAPSTRAKVVLLIVGTTISSLLDVLGVLAMVPLMSAMVGDTTASATGAGVLAFLLPAPGSESYIFVAAGLVAGAFALKAGFGIAFRWWSLGLLAHEQVRVTADMMRRHLMAPYSLHRQRGYAELTNVLNALVPGAFSGLATSLVVLSELLTVVMVAAAVIAIQPVLALVALVLLGGLGATFQFAVRRRQLRLGHEGIELTRDASAASLHAYGGVHEVKLRNNAAPFVNAYRRANYRLVQNGRMLTFISELPKYMFELLFVVLLAGAAVLMYVATGGGGGALVALATFGVAGIRLLPSAVRMLASTGILRSSLPYVTRLRGELAELDALDERVPPTGLHRFEGGLHLESVSFAYAEGQPVLREISLDIPRGTIVALVGASGAGKSTLVDIILGLQRPTSGRIECGGVDIWRSIGDWRTSVGVVPQAVFLTDDTLRHNIGFDVADAELDEDRVRDVVRRAQLDDLVRENPRGLDLRVGDRGARLSGGQRQRVGIARALYRKPSLLVLDEATSALDNMTEHRITETIEALRGEMTVVVVAHRLSTVRNADLFIVLDEGRVDAVGTFAQAQAQSAVFAEMVHLASIKTDGEIRDR